jgi:hypothetical protein
MDFIDPRWRKSTRSAGNGGGCVEAGDGRETVMVRDTMDPAWPHSAPVLHISRQAFAGLTARIKHGELDPGVIG